MIRINFETAKSVAVAVVASVYCAVMLASLSGINGAAVGQLIV